MKTDIIPVVKFPMALAFLPLAASAVTVAPLPPGGDADEFAEIRERTIGLMLWLR